MAVSRSRRARAVRRRRRRLDRVEYDLSEEQWTALKTAWGGCAYCGVTDKPLQRDCVLALSRGGRYTLNKALGLRFPAVPGVATEPRQATGGSSRAGSVAAKATRKGAR
jgi:hypothetical protein